MCLLFIFITIANDDAIECNEDQSNGRSHDDYGNDDNNHY